MTATSGDWATWAAGPQPVPGRDGDLPGHDRHRDPERAQRRRSGPQPGPDPRPLGDRRLADAGDRRDAFLLFRAADRRLALALAITRPGLRGSRSTRATSRSGRSPASRCSSSSCGWSLGSGGRTSAASGRCLGWASRSRSRRSPTARSSGVLLQVGFADGHVDPARQQRRRPRGRDDVRLPRARRHGRARVEAPRHDRHPAGRRSSSSVALFVGRADPVGGAARRRGADRRHAVPARAAGLGRAVRGPGRCPRRCARRGARLAASGHLGAASLWIVVALVLFMAVVAQFIANPATGARSTRACSSPATTRSTSA